jgi:hypothetical protein
MADREAESRPLAEASERLRGVPGFPRPRGRPPALPEKRQEGHVHNLEPATGLSPRLLDVGGAARYLGMSPWTVRDLETAGVLRRVRVPLLGTRELRKVLFDRADLDRIIEIWKA